MSIRIVHTADNHIGLPFKQYPAEVAARLVEERHAALGRLVDMANERQAHFFVVAGDLFDSTRVKAVIVVPGNHDHHAGPETEVWKRFRTAIEGDARIDLLAEPVVASYDVDGRAVHLFPCPCRSKTGSEPAIGWVADAARACADGLRIGIAHGNVTGLGLDAEGQYFTMEPQALEAAGMATWLLGHIHVPFPPAESGERSAFFMAGTHTPDSLRCRHAGSAWWIECDENRVTRYERLSSGRIMFRRIERELVSAEDVSALVRSCEALDAGTTLLDLQLSCRLSAGEQADLGRAVDRLRPRFLCLTEESDVHERIDAARIEARYRDGGLAHRLLTALLADVEHPDAATLAHDVIEELSRT